MLGQQVDVLVAIPEAVDYRHDILNFELDAFLKNLLLVENLGVARLACLLVLVSRLQLVEVLGVQLSDDDGLIAMDRLVLAHWLELVHPLV